MKNLKLKKLVFISLLSITILTVVAVIYFINPFVKDSDMNNYLRNLITILNIRFIL